MGAAGDSGHNAPALLLNAGGEDAKYSQEVCLDSIEHLKLSESLGESQCVNMK